MDENSINDAVTVRPCAGSSLGRIDQYELKRELGGGGFGTVYLARDTVSGVEVAVKGLPPFVKNNREEMDNIRANFNLVHDIHHPHIAAALYLHPAKDVAYASEDVRQKLRVLAGDTLLVMAYAPGVTLSQWRKQFPGSRVPVDKALEIVRQVAEALDYAHERKVVHRDVKPANVMIETDGSGKVTARVLDFGLAAEIRSSMGRVSKEIHDTSGTRPYMAPEQWLGGRQGPATDQYALAVLFHELVTGEVPFASVFQTGDPVVMMSVVENKAPEIDPELPRAVRLSLAKALAKKVGGRFGSCTEFVLALEGKIKVKPDSRGASPDGLSRRSSPARAAGVFAALALLGAAGIGAWHYRNLKLKAAEETQLFNMSVEAARACGPINSAAEAVRKFFAPEIGALMLNLSAGDEARKASRGAIASNLYAKVLAAAPELTSMMASYDGISGKLAKLALDRDAADRTGAGRISPELYQKARQAGLKADALLKDRKFGEAESQIDLAADCFEKLNNAVAEAAKRKAEKEAAEKEAAEKEAARQKEIAEAKLRAEAAEKRKLEAEARRIAEAAARDKAEAKRKTAEKKPSLPVPAAVKPVLPAAVKPVLSAEEKPVRRPAPPKPDARKDAGNGDEALMAQLERKGFILDARTNRHKPGTERTVDLGGGVSLVLSWCPPGWFMMGSPESEEGRKHDEVLHAVRLTKGFWIGKYEVTESQWGAVVGDGDSGEKPKCDVSWNCAQDFLRRLNARIDGASFRLPTEAEWEYACRAGAMTPFSFGVGRDGGFLDGNQATCAGRDTYPSRRKTLFGGQNAWGRDAVGSNSFYANAWGLNDMHGNVYEWCADVFAPYPSAEGVSTDPISLKGFSSTSRVIRGGCWNHAAKLCRSAFRTGKSEADRDQLTGFRVCCDDLP